jgi:glutamate-1-semialdehyde 2,1-aminomutase
MDINTGLRLWEDAKRVIPGGNGLLSKRPERYAPDVWPTYYSYAKGIKIADLDLKIYTDMAQMGIGSAVLGYADSDVNMAVTSAVSAGVNTTLNCPQEVLLAEKLLEIDTFAGGVRFARTGAEAMSIAVRIARAHTGKDKVAFSGYHGWSDWYLATNIESSDNLNDHLLEGLAPLGVPSSLSGTAIPFKYNDKDDLVNAVGDNEIAAIIIEGARYDFATPEFLETVKRVAEEKNAVIIFDEITSGWRMCPGGVYRLYDFTPDIVVYGKAMGNGFAISAVVGKQEVMDSAQDTFISSTFWTESVGFSAAIATIDKFIQNDVHKHLIDMGEFIKNEWESCFKKLDLNITVTEFLPLVTFKPDYGKLNDKILTYFTQEMLKEGYLASNSIYISYAHKTKPVLKYLIYFRRVMKEISQAIKEGNLDDLLETRCRESGFKRLT